MSLKHREVHGVHDADRATGKRNGHRPEQQFEHPLSEADVLSLQRLAGNQAVTQVLSRQRDADGRRRKSPQGSGAPSRRLVLQRHSSWEHRLLGDVDPATIQVITRVNEFEGHSFLQQAVLTSAGKGIGKERYEAVHAILQQLDNLQEWQLAPPQPGQTNWKGVQLVTIQLDEGTEVVCSVGEMNTLADYYGSLEHLKRSKATTVSQILQTVRRQGWEKLHAVLVNIDPAAAAGRKEPWFGGALPPGDDLELQFMSHDSRNKQSETYLATVARNACHFAPQSWYRWKEYHDRARSLAGIAWTAKLAADRSDNASLRKVARNLANEAVVTNGFGDHYLQDSFAAGHLINKTLVMQWFVEWLGSRDWRDRLISGAARSVGETVLGPLGGYVAGEQTETAGARYIKDWDSVRRNTPAEQGQLAGVDLYKRPKGAVATDPQSAEEQATRAERIRRLRLQGADQEKAYRDFHSMLDNAAVQLAAKELHDHFCEAGLTVFANSTRVGLIYGDGDMISGGEGVEYSAQTARKSQEAITALLTGKTPELDADAIMDRFPNRVMLPNEGGIVTLEEWHTGGKLKKFCDEVIFPKVHYRLAGRIRTATYGEVSQDRPGGGDVATPDQVYSARLAKLEVEAALAHAPW